MITIRPPTRQTATASLESTAKTIHNILLTGLVQTWHKVLGAQLCVRSGNVTSLTTVLKGGLD